MPSQPPDALLKPADKLRALLAITEKLNAQRDLSALLVLIAEEAARLLDAELASIFLLDRERDELWSKVTLDADETLRFDAGRGIAGHALRTGEILRVDDVSRDPHFFAGVDARTGHVTKNILAAPLRSLTGTTVGVFEVVNKRAGTFSKEDVEVARLLADQTSIALETAQLVGDLRRDHRECMATNARLSRELRQKYAASRILGASESIRKVVQLIEQVADSSLSVLITGESGTGKELAAKTIHFQSCRAAHPFIAVNCAALPESLAESELFGIEKGVATGVQARQGKFEAAHQGTLFLDELGDLSPSAQAKLLRVLQERLVERVGARAPTPIDVRVLAATNKDLEAAIREGHFRADLFYRLNGVEIRMPSLREIPEDIPLLVNAALWEHCRELGRTPPEVHPLALRRLQQYAWPGNVRELDNEMKRLAVTVRRDVIEETDLAPRIQQTQTTPPAESREGDLKQAVEQLERGMIQAALAECDHNQQQTARVLGLSRQGLIKKMKRYGMAAPP